jgi:hypothetical protein
VAGRTVPVLDRWAPVLTGAVVWLAVLAVIERTRDDARTRMT